jgi:hypothetical protein
MYCYLTWAQKMTALTADEIIVNVLDLALSDYFRRDRSWRSSRARLLAQQPNSDWRKILGEQPRLTRDVSAT